MENFRGLRAKFAIDDYWDVYGQMMTPEEIELALKRVKELATMSLVWSRPVCTQCEFYDFNEMSDEAYCAAKEYEPIRLYRKHRPDWCPRLKGN